MENNEKNKNLQPLFIGFTIDEEKDEYAAYLVNCSETDYENIRSLTGAYCTIDDDLLETSKSVGQRGPLAAGTKALIEKSDIDGLEFVIWYHLDLIPEVGEIKKYWFQLPKYYWVNRQEKVMIPVIKQEGWIIELMEREGELIDDEIKTLVMEAQYHRYGESSNK